MGKRWRLALLCALVLIGVPVCMDGPRRFDELSAAGLDALSGDRAKTVVETISVGGESLRSDRTPNPGAMEDLPAPLDDEPAIELSSPQSGSPLTIAPTPLDSFARNGNTSATPASYTASQVAQWAYNRSPEAKLIESEIAAVMRGIDPKDPDDCCSARLIRDVLSEVALGRRHDDAFLARQAYHKLVAAEAAMVVIDEAIAIQDELIDLATRAEKLDLPDGDPLQLREIRLQLKQRRTEQRFNALKLRQELARLTGRNESEVAHAIAIDPLPTRLPPIVASEAVAIAQNRRHDVRAIAQLCRNLRSCNVDAARLLMGMVSPGIGLSLASAAKGLFACLKDDRSDNDLGNRRRQCHEMLESLKDVVRHETLQAILNIRSAQERINWLQARVRISQERVQLATAKIELDEATVGSDLAIQLEMKELQGEQIRLMLELALAEDELLHKQNGNLP